MIYVNSAKAVRDFVAEVTFSNGETKLINLEPFLHGPIFSSIRSDRDEFLGFKIDHELGTIVWANGADIDPEVLYGKYAPAWMEEALERVN